MGATHSAVQSNVAILGYMYVYTVPKHPNYTTYCTFIGTIDSLIVKFYICNITCNYQHWYIRTGYLQLGCSSIQSRVRSSGAVKKGTVSQELWKCMCSRIHLQTLGGSVFVVTVKCFSKALRRSWIHHRSRAPLCQLVMKTGFSVGPAILFQQYYRYQQTSSERRAWG
jgi:hypothetical protein